MSISSFDGSASLIASFVGPTAVVVVGVTALPLASGTSSSLSEAARDLAFFDGGYLSSSELGIFAKSGEKSSAGRRGKKVGFKNSFQASNRHNLVLCSRFISRPGLVPALKT